MSKDNKKFLERYRPMVKKASFSVEFADGSTQRYVFAKGAESISIQAHTTEPEHVVDEKTGLVIMKAPPMAERFTFDINYPIADENGVLYTLYEGHVDVSNVLAPTLF